MSLVEHIAAQRTEFGVPHAAQPRAVPATTSSRETPAPPADADAWSPPRTTSDVEVLQRPLETGQYTSGDFAEACRRLGVTQSMGRTGSALDNACAESFISTLQHELISRRRWHTRAQARRDIATWIDTWYCQRLLGASLGGESDQPSSPSR